VIILKYNKNMTISEILFSNSKTIEVMHKYGLTCLNCLGAERETLEEVARANEIDLDKMIKDLNNLEKEDACV
jgi:hybrid cluster-associated redox disulfide protein